jgi:hypothetical protein
MIESGKLNKIIGTYELTSYTADEDRLASKGIKLFIAINSDGTGYYAYSDNETSPYCAPITCKFNPDPENSDKYNYVNIDFDGDGIYENFGVYSGWFDKNLNYSKAVFTGNILEGNLGIDYNISVKFTRVDSASNLDYIKEVFGNDIGSKQKQ